MLNKKGIKREVLGRDFYRKCSCGVLLGSRRAIANHINKGHHVSLKRYRDITMEMLKNNRNLKG